MNCMVSSWCLEGDLYGRLDVSGSLLIELLVSTVTNVVFLVFLASITCCLFEPRSIVTFMGKWVCGIG